MKAKDSKTSDKGKNASKTTTGKEMSKDLTKSHPKFPFWARLKISKKRTTLVIDEEKYLDKKTNKIEDGYVNREATHTYRKDYECIEPNPDRNDSEPMYLKRPSKKPKRMFELHNKNLDMPEHLKSKYEKNNKK